MGEIDCFKKPLIGMIFGFILMLMGIEMLKIYILIGGGIIYLVSVLLGLLFAYREDTR